MAGEEDHGIPLMPAGSGRVPTTQLRRLTDGVPGVTDPLHLVHVTAAGWAAEILRSPVPQLETRKCDVFDRHLVYFFVARAAFKPRSGEVGSDDLTRFPVAFVLRPDSLGTPAHVYPFDTGAANKGRYTGARQSGVFLQDYSLEPNIDAVRRLISWAFKTYLDYLSCRIDNDLEPKVGHHDFVAWKFLQIARLAGVGANMPDLRASTIEVAYDRHVELRHHAALVVLPEQMLEVEENGSTVAARLKALGVLFRTYRWIPGETPDRHMEDVRRLVEDEVRGTAIP